MATISTIEYINYACDYNTADTIANCILEHNIHKFSRFAKFKLVECILPAHKSVR